MPAFGVSSFLWHVLDWRVYVDWVDPGAAVYVAPEQFSRVGQPATPKIDQYMLGRLAVELLEGQSLGKILGASSAGPQDFWADPAAFVSGDWRREHAQLWSIIGRLLEPDPGKRWDSMQEVARRLRALEEEGRALAKRVFLAAADGDAERRGSAEEQRRVLRAVLRRLFRCVARVAEQVRGQGSEGAAREVDARHGCDSQLPAGERADVPRPVPGGAPGQGDHGARIRQVPRELPRHDGPVHRRRSSVSARHGTTCSHR